MDGPATVHLLALRRYDTNIERQDVEHALGLKYGALLSEAGRSLMLSLRWIITGR